MQKRKTMRIFCYVIVFLTVITITGGIILTHIEFSFPKLRETVSSKLSGILETPVNIESFSVKLSRGIKIGNMSLGERDSELFSAKSLILQCNLLGMLRHRFNVRSLIIDKPVFTIRRNAGGFMFPFPLPGHKVSGSGSKFEFQLAKAIVKDGKVTVKGGRAGSGKNSLTVDEINFEISSEGECKPVKIKGRGNFAPAIDFSVDGSYTEYSAGRFKIDDFKLGIGENIIRLTGVFNSVEKTFKLKLISDSMNLQEIVKCILPFKDAEARGKAKIDFRFIKEKDTSLKIDGNVEIKNWKYNSFAGEHLSCNVKNKDKQVVIEDILVIIGEGTLKGSGVVGANGKYRFSIKGENIDMKKLLNVKKDGEVEFSMSGKADMDANITNSGGGTEGLGGRGNVKIESGTIKSFSWLEELFSAIHLPELMPFNYNSVTSSFVISKGKLTLYNTAVIGKEAIIRTEKGEIDLVGKTKNISADFALAPHLVERERSKFKEFDKFFFVDENGYAHLSLVWKGSLSKGSPDLTASLLKTGVKKYLPELLEKLLGNDKDK